MSHPQGDDAAGSGARGGRARAATGLNAPRWLVLGFASVLVGLLVSLFLAGVVVVHGHSMEPTLHNGERVLVLRTGAWLHRLGLGSYTPGDIVFFPDPSRPETRLGRVLGEHLLIKRIVAGSGATVAMRAGVLYVDGRARPERYLAGAFRGLASVPVTRVPAGRVYVMGDNRRPTASFDSRAFGPVRAGSIEGRAVLVVWPLIRRGPDGWRWNVRLLTGSTPQAVTGGVAAAH
ncbi:MAG: signal peptidase I [Deinococcales bacterium]